MEKNEKNIEYPYLPEGREILYVPADNEFMEEAREYAKKHSLDKTMPNASVIVRDGKVIALGANGSNFHDNNECERIKQNTPTGQGYELCEGCHPKNHGEQSAILNAKENEVDIKGSDLYLWGHWWCCESCWNAMIKVGIKDVYLLKDSEKLFNKSHPDNVVGKQFD